MSDLQITEKYLLEIGGWKVMKEARRAFNSGAVEQADFDGTKILRGSVRSNGKSMIAGLVFNGRTDIENLCKCYESRRMGIICMHSMAVGLEIACGTGKKSGSVKAAQSTSGSENGSPTSTSETSPATPQGPAVPLRVVFSESWLSALRKGRLAARCEPGSADREGLSSDRRLGAWLSENGLDQLPAHLSPPPSMVADFLRAAAGLPEIQTADAQDLGIGEIAARLPATVEAVDEDTFSISVTLGDNTEVFELGDEREQWILNHEVRRLLPAPVISTDPELIRELIVDGKSVTRGLGWIMAHLAVLRDVFNFQGESPLDAIQITEAVPEITLSLEGSLNYIEAHLSAHYQTGEIKIAIGAPSPDGAFPFEDRPDQNPDPNSLPKRRFLTRGNASEKAAIQILENHGFELAPKHGEGGFKLQGEADVLRFCSSGLRKLKSLWKVNLGDRLDTILSRFSLVSPQIVSTSDSDSKTSDWSGGSQSESWFGFSIQHVADGSGTPIPAADIARLIRTGSPKLDLPGGKKALVDIAAIEELQTSLESVGMEQEAGSGDGVSTARAPIDSLGFLRETIEELGGSATSLPEAFPEPDEATLSVALPDLAPILRDYQTTGVRWLCGRLAAGSGAVLADEMGLGKTVQTLAAIQFVRSQAGATTEPTLVVCPTSLLHNWEQEILRFVPDLSVLVYHGPKRDSKAISTPDIVVTSYGLISRDEALQNQIWDTVVLDEASLIRNPDAKTSKAARGLQTQRRLALTGTPIENRPTDLWALMAFVRPGYLGDRKAFAEQYEKPLTGTDPGERRAVAGRLRRRISPFVLRRRKQEVAKDLPQKIERIVPIELLPRQQEAYQRLLEEGLSHADDLRKSSGDNAARMSILTTLLRLRQTCCDLRLLGLEEDAPEAESSAKVQAFRDLVSEAIEGGHRVLVFSQFAKMLRILRKELEAGNVPYCYLDGSSQDRPEQVKRFQSSPEIPVFLISLKAGGYGLNLTAADTVIHFDPWWNPAVEAQATDRAHRIGQDRPVTVHKLVTRGTVEENILRLQKRKRDILDASLDDEMPMMGGLQDADLEALLE